MKKFYEQIGRIHFGMKCSNVCVFLPIFLPSKEYSFTYNSTVHVCVCVCVCVSLYTFKHLSRFLNMVWQLYEWSTFKLRTL